VNYSHILKKRAILYGAPIMQAGVSSLNEMQSETDMDASRPSASRVSVVLFKKCMSSLVVLSYLSLTVGQAYAMDGKVTPFDGPEGIALSSCTTPQKFNPNKVVPIELDSPTSVARLHDHEMENGSGNKSSSANSFANDTQQERKVSDPSSLRDAENTHEISDADPLAAVGMIFKLDENQKVKMTRCEEIFQGLTDIYKTTYLAGSFAVDSVINAPVNSANAVTWVDGCIKKLRASEVEMPGEEAYSKPPIDFYRDNDYYGAHKDSYMQSLLTTIVFGSVIYSINAKAKFAGYTIFDALAKKAEMYELLYYEHADNPYYYQDQFMSGMFIYSWIALPFFLLFQSSELSKILWPTREEARLKEHHGFYTEHTLNFLSAAFAVMAGYFAYSAYYTSASGLLGTPHTTEKDLTTYPAFLGYSTALTIYTIARRGSDEAYRYLSRHQYGDKGARERGMNEEAIDFYKESMNKKFNTVKVSPEQQPSSDAKLKIADGVDLEAPKRSIQKKEKRKTVFGSSDAIEELETRLASLTGTELLTEVLDHWFNHKPVVERHKSHDLAAIKKLQEQSEASLCTQFMQGAYNSSAWVVKNSWWIVPVIVCSALVYPSYASCVELVQWSIKDDPQAVSDYVLGQQAALKYEIISGHEDEILADPVKWQTDCFDSMKISANVTDDENFYAYYYEANNNQTADYFLHFTTPDCLGIEPEDEWIAAPKDLNINYDNAVIWFNAWKNGYAAVASANAATTFSTTTNILANIAGGIYAPSIYGLSVLGASFILYQGRETLMNPELTVCGKVLNILGNALVSTPAFTQGVIESASQGIEGYLALDGEFSDWAVYSCTGLITAVSALILTPDFYKVQEKIVNKLEELVYGRSAQKELSRKFNELKELNGNAKTDILKVFYKNYER
jgi:hypothetical protein